jgi:hypothetical protein
MATSKALISVDEYSGIKQYHHYDSDTDTSVFESVADCEPTLELNKSRANDTDLTKQGFKDEMWLYASIPNILVLKLMTEKNINVYKRADGNRLSKVLEDPEYRHLKCTTKKHIIKAYD